VTKLQLGIASKTNADDIPTAYLNAFLHEDKLQVMRMPKYLADLISKVDPKTQKYLQPDGSLLNEVLRALYGFPESAKLWNEQSKVDTSTVQLNHVYSEKLLVIINRAL